MPAGMPVSRQWIYVLVDGRAVIEWEDNMLQDLMSGEFIRPAEAAYSHPIQDDELDILRRAGRVDRYDSREVYIYSLPEPPRRTLD
jgi:hypothetical protein